MGLHLYYYIFIKCFLNSTRIFKFSFYVFSAMSNRNGVNDLKENSAEKEIKHKYILTFYRVRKHRIQGGLCVLVPKIS